MPGFFRLGKLAQFFRYLEDVLTKKLAEDKNVDQNAHKIFCHSLVGVKRGVITSKVRKSAHKMHVRKMTFDHWSYKPQFLSFSAT